MRLHKQLQRIKAKKPASARLTQLEEVLGVLQRYESWRTDAELRSFAGPSFKEGDTPLTELTQLSQWVKNVAKRLQVAQIGSAVFDPLAVKAIRLLNCGR